jgi:glycosyltransferase involved in cell wall biosynthesis
MNFSGHTHFVTIGMSIGSEKSKVPTCGHRWITTPQPIVLEHWPVVDTPVTYDALTTVANWRGYGSVEHEGVMYGQKVHSLRQFMSLPTKTEENFTLALSIHGGEVRDLAALKENGWKILDPAEVAPSPRKYQTFVQNSKGEFGIAKSGYVHADCGWLSDRSLCYLASGRPVIAQDTGFTRYFPAGEGLLSFRTEADALASIEAMNRDYERHRRAARAVAEMHFDSDRVLNELLAKLM